MVEYFLALDEPRSDDTVVVRNGITYVYNQKALEEIGPYLKIDFRTIGFVLINREQTLAYGLRLKSM